LLTVVDENIAGISLLNHDVYADERLISDKCSISSDGNHSDNKN